MDFITGHANLKRNLVDYKQLKLPRKPKKPKIPPKGALRTILMAAMGSRSAGEHATPHVTRAAVVTLSLFGTLPRGEVVGLKWKDVDFGLRILRIERNMSYHDGVKAPKTAAGVRPFAMTRPIHDALMALRAFRDGRSATPAPVTPASAARASCARATA